MHFKDYEKKILGGILVTLMLIVMQTSIVFGGSWNDTGGMLNSIPRYLDLPQNHWANSYITDITSKGIVEGYPDGTFKPNVYITFGEFIKMAIRATKNGSTSKPAYESMKNWEVGYYKKGLELKYYTKFDIDVNMLKRPIQRKHMALIIGNSIGDHSIESYDGLASGIKDVNYLTSCEYQIVKSYAAGILLGYNDGYFEPDSFLSRSEAAAAISRLFMFNDTEKFTNDEEDKAIDNGSIEDITRKSNDSASERYDIRDYITNLEEMYQFDFGNKKYCEIINENHYYLSLYKSLLGGEALLFDDVDRLRGVAIIKDGIAQELGHAGGNKYYITGQVDKPFPRDFDYICIYYSPSDTVTLFSNPFDYETY